MTKKNYKKIENCHNQLDFLKDPEARAIVDQRMYFDMGAFYKVKF